MVEVPSLDPSQVTIPGDESFYTDLERRGVCRVKLANGSYREINFPQWPMCLTFRQNRYCLEPNKPAPKGFSVEWNRYLLRGPTWDKWDASIRNGEPLFGKPTMSREQLYRSPVVTYMAKLQQPTQVAMGRLGSVAHHLHNQLECFVTSQHHWKPGEIETSTEFDASILHSLPQHTPLGVFSQPSQIVSGKLYTTRPRPRYSVLHREDGYFVSIPRQPYSGDKDQFAYFDPIHFQEFEFEQFAAARLNTHMAKRLFGQHTRAPLLFACNARYEEQGQTKHCSQPDLAVNIRYCTRCDTTLCSHKHSDPGECSQHAASGDFDGPAQIVGYVGIIMGNFLKLLRALEAQKNDLVVHYQLMTRDQFFAVLDQVQYNFVNFMDTYFHPASETIISNGLRWEPISIQQSRDSLSHVCKNNVQNPNIFWIQKNCRLGKHWPKGQWPK